MNTRAFYACFAACMATLLSPTLAFAQYDYDESCAPTKEHEVFRDSPPLLIVLDRSGSMRGRGNSAGDSKLTIAKEVISEVVTSSFRDGECSASSKVGCDTAKVGLGWFSTSYGLSVQAGEDTKDEVIERVNAYNTNGATYVGGAAELIFRNEVIKENEGLNVGVLVSDGQPWASSTSETRDTVEQALQYLCDARDRRPGQTLTFGVGFGRGASPRMNSLFAAAGGTGQCCIGSALPGSPKCTYQPFEELDPCELPRRLNGRIDATAVTKGSRRNQLADHVQCKGSLQANSGQELKNSFMGILGRSSCTFTLDIPLEYPSKPGADADPEATRVVMDHTLFGPDIRIPYVGDFYTLENGESSPRLKDENSKPDRFPLGSAKDDPETRERYEAEGWIWANPQRTAVILTDTLCHDTVSAQRVTKLETQVACICANTGEACDVPCYREGCVEAQRCEEKSGLDQEECFKGCKYDEFSSCEMGTNTLYNRQEMQQVGRCLPGTIQCIIGKEYCPPDYSAEPEVCNGIDDNCNQRVDDLASAKDSSKGPYYDSSRPEQRLAVESSPLKEGLFCGYRNDACGCNGSPDSYGTPTRVGGVSGFAQVVQEASKPTSACNCVEALELGGQEVVSKLGGTREMNQGCTSAPSEEPPRGWVWGIILGALGLMVRRRR